MAAQVIRTDVGMHLVLSPFCRADVGLGWSVLLRGCIPWLLATSSPDWAMGWEPDRCVTLGRPSSLRLRFLNSHTKGQVFPHRVVH